MSYLIRRSELIRFASQNWTTGIQGVSANFPPMTNWQIAAGRAITPEDDRSSALVAVLGETVRRQLFGTFQNPIGPMVQAKGVSLRVVGILDSKGQTSFGQDQIYVQAVDQTGIQAAIDQATESLAHRHRIRPGTTNEFSVRNLSQIAQTAEGSSRIMALLLAAAASISLVVGGIGSMNILLVSVTERTR